MKSIENIHGLKKGINYPILAFDSQIGYLVKTENGNFKWLPNNCFEYDEMEWYNFKDSKTTVLEKINDFRYLYLPTKWTQVNRTNSITDDWSIQLRSLTDKIGLAISLKEQNEEIGPELSELYNNDTLRFAILKERINQLGNIQYFLSDGYNVASMRIEKLIGGNLNDKQIVSLKYRMKLNHEIDGSKIKQLQSNEIATEIKKSITWNLTHLESFNNSNQLFKKDFHRNIYLEILNGITKDLVTYSRINNSSVSIFKQFETEGDRFIIFKAEKFNTIFELNNGVH